MVAESLDKRLSPEDLPTVETERALYRIIYNSHEFIIPREYTEGTDALALEAGLKYAEADVREVVSNAKNDLFGYHDAKARSEYYPAYQDILHSAFSTQQPVYLTDAILSIEEVMRMYSRHSIARSLSSLGVVGIPLGINKLLKGHESHSLSRRKFLTSLSLVSGGSYLSLPGYLESIELASMVDEHSSGGTFPTWFQNTADWLIASGHPLLSAFGTHTRSLIIASKAEAAAERILINTGKKPTIALTIGYGHHDIEKSLSMSPKKRISEIADACEGSYASLLPLVIEVIGDYESDGGQRHPSIRSLEIFPDIPLAKALQKIHEGKE